MLVKIEQKLKALSRLIERPEYQKMVSDFRRGILRENLPCSKEQALDFALITGNVGFFHALFDDVYKEFNFEKALELLCLALVQFPETNKTSFSIINKIKSKGLQSLFASNKKEFFKVAFKINNLEFFQYILAELDNLGIIAEKVKESFQQEITVDDICLNIQNGFFDIVDCYLNFLNFNKRAKIVTDSSGKILHAFYSVGELEKVYFLIHSTNLENSHILRMLEFYMRINNFKLFCELLNRQKNPNDFIMANDASLLNQAFRCNNSKFAQHILKMISEENKKALLSVRIRMAQQENALQGRAEIFKFLWEYDDKESPVAQICAATCFQNSLLGNAIDIEIARFIWMNSNHNSHLSNVINYDLVSSCLHQGSLKSVRFLLSEISMDLNKKSEIIRKNTYKLFAELCSAGDIPTVELFFNIIAQARQNCCEESEIETEILTMILSFSGFSIRVAAENNNYELLEILLSKLPAKNRFELLSSKVPDLFNRVCLQQNNQGALQVITCCLQNKELDFLSERLLENISSINSLELRHQFVTAFSCDELKRNAARLLDLKSRGFSFSQIFEISHYQNKILPLVLVSKKILVGLPEEINHLIAFYLAGAMDVYEPVKFGFIVKSTQLETVRLITNSYGNSENEKQEAKQLRVLQVMN